MKLSQSLSTPRSLASVGLIAFVLVLNALVVHRNAVSLHDTHSLVLDTEEILADAEMIFRDVVEAESAVKGYVITGSDSQLRFYHEANNSLLHRLQSLRQSVAGHPLLSSRTRDIEDQVNARLGQLHHVVRARTEDGFNLARSAVEADNGKHAMDQIRESMKQLKAESEGLLRQRIANADQRLTAILFANGVGVLLCLIVTGVAWELIERHVRKCTEAEIHADAERENLLVTLTSIGEAVVVTDAMGIIQLSNPVANELIGTKEGLVGKSLEDVFVIIGQSNRLSVGNPISCLRSMNKPLSLSDQSILILPDTTEVPIEHTAAPIRNKAGEVTGFALVFRDCSERFRIEKDLIKRERRFRKMFETPLLGIAVSTGDGRALLEANDAYLDLIGYDRGERLESSLGWGGVIAEQSPLDAAAQKELQDTGVCRPFEKVYTRNDGTIVPVLISSSRLFDDEDGVIVFITDLTRAKQSEDALRDSEDRFRILSESMPQMVWMALPDGQIVYVNRTMVEYSGQTIEELTDWGWTSRLHPDERGKLLYAWKTALKMGKPMEIEHRLQHVSGEFRWHLTRARPMYGPQENITRWVGTSTDIHDHKRVEAILREEHQRKDRFLALVAHELRNPIAPLANAVQVFDSVRNDATASRELLAIMQRQIKQMTRLIEDLLDISRITQDKIILRREKIRVDAAIAAAVEAVKPLVHERSQNLVTTIPGELLWIDADLTRMSQILTNLLQNAAKYSEPGSRITISAERIDQEVFLRVVDNGIGMSELTVASLFNPNFDDDTRVSRAQGGLGLGLKLVRALVELHGGKVSARSDGVGRGSEFVIRLPLVVEQERQPADDANPPAVDPTRYSRMKVLVVDDVKASAKTLALMLSVLGPKVETAFDGSSAIETIRNSDFDIVFLDIAMPGLDGLEVARKLRSDQRLDALWLVALTGFGQNDDRQRCLDAGFNEHMTKPANMNLLKDVLQRAFRSSALPVPALR